MLALLCSVMSVRDSCFFKSWLKGSWIRPLFIIWWRLKPFEAALKLSFGPWTVWFPLKSIKWRKSWDVHFFSTEKRKTWTSWMTWGWLNYQQFFFLKWTTPLKLAVRKEKELLLPECFFLMWTLCFGGFEIGRHCEIAKSAIFFLYCSF